MCRESTGPVAGSGGVCSVLIFRPKGGLVHVSGTVSEMAAQNLFPGGGPGPHHRHPPAAGGRGPHGPRLSVHRHPGHRQNHLRPDPGQGRQLPAPGGRGPLQPVRGLPGHRQRLPAGRDGAGRRQQQPGGRHPGTAQRVGIHPHGAEKAGLYHRRGPHAVHPGLQRPAENH
mgnify:CR=1 FL=1